MENYAINEAFQHENVLKLKKAQKSEKSSTKTCNFKASKFEA